MSILDTDKIDILQDDINSNNVLLIITDHLDWEYPYKHLAILEDKINAYIRYIESGQYESECPEFAGKPIQITIVSKHNYPVEAQNYLEKVQTVINAIGVSIKQVTKDSE